MNNENNAIHTENENKNEDSALKAKIDGIVDKIKELVKKGNVSRVIIRRDGNINTAGNCREQQFPAVLFFFQCLRLPRTSGSLMARCGLPQSA